MDGLGLAEDMATTDEGVMMVILGVLSSFVRWVVVEVVTIDFGLNVGAVRISMSSGCCELLEAAAEARSARIKNSNCNVMNASSSLILFSISPWRHILREAAVEAAAVLVSEEQGTSNKVLCRRTWVISCL